MGRKLGARRAALCAALAATGALAAGGSTAAAQTAATTVGATGYDALLGNCLPGTQAVGRDAVTQDGTVTELRFTGAKTLLGGSARLQVLRPQGNGRYTVLGQTAAVANPRTGKVVGAPVSIPVTKGDVLGLAVTGGAQFPCFRRGTSGDLLALPQLQTGAGSTVQSLVVNPLPLKLNLQAVVTPPKLLVKGKGTNVVGVQFDFEVFGTPEAPTGKASFTTASGAWVRSGPVVCYRQISDTRALFGIKDVTGGPDPVYREFYVSDAPNGDRQTEWGIASADVPPAGCRTETPPENAGWRVVSGDITFTDVLAGWSSMVGSAGPRPHGRR